MHFIKCRKSFIFSYLEKRTHADSSHIKDVVLHDPATACSSDSRLAMRWFVPSPWGRGCSIRPETITSLAGLYSPSENGVLCVVWPGGVRNRLRKRSWRILSPDTSRSCSPRRTTSLQCRLVGGVLKTKIDLDFLSLFFFFGKTGVFTRIPTKKEHAFVFVIGGWRK